MSGLLPSSPPPAPPTPRASLVSARPLLRPAPAPWPGSREHGSDPARPPQRKALLWSPVLMKGCSPVGTQGLGHKPPCQSQPWEEAPPRHTPPHPGPGRRRPICPRAPPCLAHPTPTSPFAHHISSASLHSSSPSVPPTPQALPPLAAPHPSPSSQPAAGTSASSARPAVSPESRPCSARSRARPTGMVNTRCSHQTAQLSRSGGLVFPRAAEVRRPAPAHWGPPASTWTPAPLWSPAAPACPFLLPPPPAAWAPPRTLMAPLSGLGTLTRLCNSLGGALYLLPHPNPRHPCTWGRPPGYLEGSSRG